MYIVRRNILNAGISFTKRNWKAEKGEEWKRNETIH